MADPTEVILLRASGLMPTVRSRGDLVAELELGAADFAAELELGAADFAAELKLGVADLAAELKLGAADLAAQLLRARGTMRVHLGVPAGCGCQVLIADCGSMAGED